jgi:hypothetical protein
VAAARSPRQAAEVPIFHGGDQLAAFPGRTDIAVCLLPLTAETEAAGSDRRSAVQAEVGELAGRRSARRKKRAAPRPIVWPRPAYGPRSSSTGMAVRSACA